jgi:undecaprenyl-diphosphatase
LTSAANLIAASHRHTDDLIMLRNRSFRGRDLTLWACWLAALAAFVALCAAVYHRHPLDGDMRSTLWVQDLARLPLVPQLFEFANAAGDANRVAALAGVIFVFLLLRGLRFEAAIVAGIIAVRLLQLAIRETVAWPAGQAEYFMTTRPLPDGGSFLSGHVLGQVLVYGLLFAYAPRITSFKLAVIATRIFCALVIALGGPARMFVGAHWPSDVIGSALLAMLYLLPALWLDTRRQRASQTQVHRDLKDVVVLRVEGRPYLSS